MEKRTIVNFLDEFYKENMSGLLSNEEMDKLMNSFLYWGPSFSYSGYGGVTGKRLFGFKSGIIITDKCVLINGKNLTDNENKEMIIQSFSLFLNVKVLEKQVGFKTITELHQGSDKIKSFNNYKYEVLLIEKLKQKIIAFQNHTDSFYKMFNENKKTELQKSKQEIIKTIDVNENEIPNIIEIETYSEFLKKFENEIIKHDPKHILDFVKLENFLNAKRNQILFLHKQLLTSNSIEILNEVHLSFQNQNILLKQLVLYSINMINALVDGKLILYYKLREYFDGFGIFNSHWEKSILKNMQDVNVNLKKLIESINEMESSISSALMDLSFEIKESINDMKESVVKKLESVDRSLTYTTLFTAVTAYQTYKIKKNIEIK